MEDFKKQHTLFFSVFWFWGNINSIFLLLFLYKCLCNYFIKFLQSFLQYCFYFRLYRKYSFKQVNDAFYLKSFVNGFNLKLFFLSSSMCKLLHNVQIKLWIFTMLNVSTCVFWHLSNSVYSKMVSSFH